MRNFLIAAIFASCLACSNDPAQSKEQSNSNLVTEFLANTNSLEASESKNPIVEFQKLAQDAAAKTMKFDKSNISNLLTQAKDYKYLVITVEDHTIVKITNLEDCNNSGSWGACMPHGEGYIKKGKLVSQDDYINNIMGRPDDQKRQAFLFK